MMGSKVWLVLVVAAAAGGWRSADASAETMKDITTGFMKVMNQCKHELNLQENIMVDLYHFWKEDYELLHRELGCAIVCMSRKLNLLDEEGKLHHGNAAEFAQSHGADHSMASQLVELIHSCEKQFDSIEDECARVLEVAKCFRTGVHGLQWAPDVKLIIEEVLTEI